jgi:hypothetical protein
VTADVLASGGIGSPVAAFSVSSAADTVTRTMVAVLTLIAAVLVAAGLTRAWTARRQPQVVIEDVVPVDGLPWSAAPGLSARLRQAVRLELAKESRAGSKSAIETLNQDIESGLLHASGSVQVTAIKAGLRSTIDDSLTTLAAGLRAVASQQAEGLLAVLAAVLPAQRGWTARVSPVVQGSGAAAQAGMMAELAELNHPPDAVTTFWSCSAGGSDEAGIPPDRLLDPTALWIATRLVSHQLVRSRPPRRWQLRSSRARLTRELAGLQRQLSGQLALYAMGKQAEFERGFAAQALADLVDAAELLPEYYRPDSATAAVHERLGWSYRRSGDAELAADEFRAGVAAYSEALRKLAQVSEAHPGQQAAAVERAEVRRAKCRLLSGDPDQLNIASAELVQLEQLKAETSRDLYNGACLFAVAIGCPALPSYQALRLTSQAWHLLGRALLADDSAGAWSRTKADVELDGLDRAQRARFCVELRTRHQGGTPLTGADALALIRQSMQAIGLPEERPEAVARTA